MVNQQEQVLPDPSPESFLPGVRDLLCGRENLPSNGNISEDGSNDSEASVQSIDPSEESFAGCGLYGILLSCGSVGKIPPASAAVISATESEWKQTYLGASNSSSLKDQEVTVVVEDAAQSVQWVRLGHSDEKIHTTDVSYFSWGVHLDSRVARGIWFSRKAWMSSNQRELLAVQRAIDAFQSDLMGCNLQIRSDNVTTIAYINKQWGTRSLPLQAIAVTIFYWAKQILASILAIQLKGS